MAIRWECVRARKGLAAQCALTLGGSPCTANIIPITSDPRPVSIHKETPSRGTLPKASRARR